MKTILLPFRDDDWSESALRTAHAIARQHQCHIEGLFVVPEPQFVSGGIPIPDLYLMQMAENGEQRAVAARERFDAYLQSSGLQRAKISDPGPGPSASWYEIKGIESQVIGERGRLFDLILVGREQEGGDWMSACEAALFDTGKPVLVAAEQVNDSFSDNVVVAWNSSAETARAVALGLPLIANASQVTVLSTPGASVPGPDGAEFAAHLRRNGIDATHDTIETTGGEETGAATLDYVRTKGANLLIKGAYTHTRLRQIVFGGATRHILANAEVPVLLAH